MNFLEAHPKAAAIVALWRAEGQFVPHLWNGKLCGTDAEIMSTVAVPDPLPIKDFIIGMELLGFQFSIGELRGRPALVRLEPEFTPEAWDRYALRLMARASGPQKTRQAISFLRQRDAW